MTHPLDYLDLWALGLLAAGALMLLGGVVGSLLTAWWTRRHAYQVRKPLKRQDPRVVLTRIVLAPKAPKSGDAA